MTRLRCALFIFSFVATLAFSGASGCVFSANDELADDCEESDDCGRADLVCVLLDEAAPGGQRVCLPMHTIDEPLACSTNADCPAQGYPVDATCDDVCQCVGDTFDCGSDLVLDPLTCKCIQP